MHHILFWLILIVLVAVAASLLYAFVQKPAFSTVREAEFNASPAKIYANINDFHKWSAWSPWEKMDPDLKRNFSGPESGIGAKYGWTGNKKVGEGMMETTHSTPDKSMQLDLHFIKPFKASHITEFTLTPIANGGTRMKWEMRGERPFGMRIFGLFMNLDKLIGKDFEKGMANLKAIVE
jgi:Polyketide cyclase / dehydrase and lipid transport